MTENEITRWLGRRAKAAAAEVSLESVNVKTILKEKDPFFKNIAIFHFAKLDASVEEVMGRFSTEPALEAILLTSSGSKKLPSKASSLNGMQLDTTDEILRSRTEAACPFIIREGTSFICWTV